MKITEFVKAVSKKKGSKYKVPVSHVAEIVRTINDLTDGYLYSFILFGKGTYDADIKRKYKYIAILSVGILLGVILERYIW
jgi:hypothetical protein